MHLCFALPWLPLRSVFDDVTRLAKAEWPESHQVMFEDDVTPAEFDVYADRDLLEPVLLNLVRNAWQATLGVADPHTGSDPYDY